VNRKQALAQSRASLTDHNIDDASIEAELLLRHALQISRAELFTELTCELSPEQEKTFQQLVKRRLAGEPSAYITGHREFYGNDFYVNSAVLIPRPESELLVDKAIELARKRAIATIADIGTGCGAIAVSLALNLPETTVYATDISAAALKVAGVNIQRHGLTGRVRLLRGNMLAPLPKPVDLIVANLPYVKESELPPTGEPPLALNGGMDGLDKIARLCGELNGKLTPRGSVLLEIGQGQGEAVVSLLRRCLPSAQIEVSTDLGGIDRVVSLHLTVNFTNC